MCVYTCTSLKVVSYYDFSVLSMSVMGFQKSFGGGCVSSIQLYFGLLEFAKPLSNCGVLGGHRPVTRHPIPTVPPPSQHHDGPRDVTQRETHPKLPRKHDCRAGLSQRQLRNTVTSKEHNI